MFDRILSNDYPRSRVLAVILVVLLFLANLRAAAITLTIDSSASE